jgi:protein disulfide-isomerase-like protein
MHQVLTNDNFDEAVARFDVMLVEFYAPWCGFCKKLKPEYEKIATQLKQEDYPIGVGKVDVTKEEMVGDRYKVESYPVLKIFVNHDKKNPVNLKLEGEKGNPAEVIADYARKERKKLEFTGDAVFTSVGTVAELNSLKDQHAVVCMGVFKSKDDALFKTYVKVRAYNLSVIV